MNPRTCIATREEKSPDEMIRFVLDGNDRVVPDLKRNLPGRGVWTACGASHVKQALDKSLFARGFKKKVTVDPDLPDLVDRMMVMTALGSLSMARKAGMLVPGKKNVEKAISGGAAAVLLHGTDSNGDGKRKLDHLVEQVDPTLDVFEVFESVQLDQVSGVANTMHLAIIDSGIADKINDMLAKLKAYRSS